jgi:pilus assembly protein Flp/PilA
MEVIMSSEYASQLQSTTSPSTQVVRRLFKDSSGVTAIEYALIAALIAVAAITAMGLVGTGLNNTFSSISSQL